VGAVVNHGFFVARTLEPLHFNKLRAYWPAFLASGVFRVKPLRVFEI
jgi:hypothetical protein